METAEQYVPLIVHETRNFNLTYYKGGTRTPEETEALAKQYGGTAPVDVPETEVMTMLPGLNWPKADDLRKAGFNPDQSNVRCTIQDPTTLPLFQAQELVKRTVSRTALTLWRVREQRPEVQSAIDSRLAGMRR